MHCSYLFTLYFDGAKCSHLSTMVSKRVRNAVLGRNLRNDRMISVCLQGKPFNIMVIQVYAPTIYAKEAEVERFYKDL